MIAWYLVVVSKSLGFYRIVHSKYMNFLVTSNNCSHSLHNYCRRIYNFEFRFVATIFIGTQYLLIQKCFHRFQDRINIYTYNSTNQDHLYDFSNIAKNTNMRFFVIIPTYLSLLKNKNIYISWVSIKMMSKGTHPSNWWPCRDVNRFRKYFKVRWLLLRGQVWLPCRRQDEANFSDSMRHLPFYG